MINLVNYTGIGKKKHLMMLITLHISGCITIISLIEYRILFYLTDFSNDINKTVMFPLLLFLFPFCFVLGILDTILHTILHYTCQLLEIPCEGWGECFLLQIFLCFNIPSQGLGGGGVSYCLFIFMYQDYSKIFCISMLHTTHGRLVVKLLHSD